MTVMTATWATIPSTSARTTLPRAASRRSSGFSSASSAKSTTMSTTATRSPPRVDTPPTTRRPRATPTAATNRAHRARRDSARNERPGDALLGIAVAGGPARVGQVRRGVRHGDIHTNVVGPRERGRGIPAGSSLAFGTTPRPPANPDGASMTQPDASAPAPRNVLVTGGNRGIGLAIARAFVEGGDNVVITNRKGDAPEGLRGVKCEVTDTESVNAAFDEAEQLLGGPIEVLVANAGDHPGHPADADERRGVRRRHRHQPRRRLQCVRRASKGMIRLRRGRIVLISSVVGLYGAPGQANYAASKSGLVGMARSITRELGGRGITANVVAPGFIDTEMTPGPAREGPRVLPRRHPRGPVRRSGGGRERGAVHCEPRGRIHQRCRDPRRRRRRHGPLSRPSPATEKAHNVGISRG